MEFCRYQYLIGSDHYILFDLPITWYQRNNYKQKVSNEGYCRHDIASILLVEQPKQPPYGLQFTAI